MMPRAISTARVFSLTVALVLGASVVACGGDAGASASGLVTVFDSTRADTVVARTAGDVPATDVRRLAELVRIAPAADDTSLFGEVFEFDVGRAGELYVFDDAAHQILLFDSTGALVRRIGRAGSGPGEFAQNGGMVVLPDGRLAQWDSRNARVSFFTAGGDFTTSWVVTGGFSTSHGLRTDRSGALLWYRPVTAPREGEILGRFGLVRLVEGGGFRDSLVPPDLPVERIVYVARREGSTSASSAAHSAQFHWAWHPDGYFVSVNGGEYAVESSRPGRAVRIVRDAPVIPVSEEEQAFQEERITANLRGLDPGWTFPGPRVATKAPVVGLRVARDGRIWVQVATPSELIPEAERDVQQPNRPPVPRYRHAIVYEVFAPDGRFLGKVPFPHATTWMEADGDAVWYLTRDADGLPAVVKARIEPALR